MTNIAIFAAGCFWGVEEEFISTKGVKETEVGYIGGTTKEPTYEEVCKGNTYHAEAVKVYFEEKIISYGDLLNIFFEIHNPTTVNRQGVDLGTQYRSSIFYLDGFQKLSGENKIKQLNKEKFNNKIVTLLEKATEFWVAEEYHQKYIRKKKFSNYVK
ncbi:MAG: peptide-methionine (S)-S-oxide reductase [Gammaproteobacteria bacterium]|nr:peptide-methionine (S)-S-oxide reductase [Gammaproteobacteria bacterium]MBJ41348.1 peptide-methionine (S)-S-oxide reductase [Gammaproteobacteria bacterium]|tara:strand:- start:43 stop:513 length:471 start_codon:yes stop_codon:yes gene_type:complete